MGESLKTKIGMEKKETKNQNQPNTLACIYSNLLFIVTDVTAVTGLLPCQGPRFL